jgi:hypothetical protein
MTRDRGRARPRHVQHVADNPERGKAQGRNDRRHHRCLISSIPATRTDHGSEAQKPDRIDECPGRPPFRSAVSPTGGTITPTKNIGARTRSINRHVGPDEQRCSLKQADGDRPNKRVARAAPDGGATESSHPVSRGVYPARPPADREQTCEGCNPRSAAGRHEGRTQPPGQAAEPGERKRVRNTACEKRPRRMTRPRTGRREPAPIDVVG